ncbi:helix-turn-helix transcriptional regulator [Psychrilyobacter sp.]|uniref:helix-turn-helix domain-containing protein n=1 Tax=Psychrilyobacter sp. TaxID=2586924 RepID=UPI003017FA55
MKANKKELMKVITVEDNNLKRFVSRYWIFKKTGKDEKIPKLFPMVSTHILMHLEDECVFEIIGKKIGERGNQILHPITNICEVFYGLNTHLIGVELSIQGYYYLTGDTPEGKIDTIEPLKEVDQDLDRFAGEITEDLAEGNFRKLEDYLKKRFEIYYTDEDARIVYSAAKEMDRDQKISELAEKYNISVRTLERKFKKNTGLTLKKYQLIVRLNKLLEDIYMTENINWSELALNHGFFDQAHMISVLKKYLGKTPNKYLEVRDLIGDLFVIDKR